MTNANFTHISQYRDVESLHYFDILKEQGTNTEEIYRILRERSRDNSRTPMQWEAGGEAGFTTGSPWISVNKNCEVINVKESLDDQNSIFYFYQKLIQLRKEYDVISQGSYEPVLIGLDGIFAYKRSYHGERLLVVAELFGMHRKVEFSENLEGDRILLSNYENTRIDKTTVCLNPYGVVMLHQKEG